MLAIRLQRNGRKGHAQYRMIVQDARKSPTSGKIVLSLGSYNPHSKSLVIDKEKADFYLKNGAQPSPRVASLLSKDGVKLPTWVSVAPKKERTIRNADKLRKNRPAEEVAAPVAEAPAAEAVENPEAAEDAVATETSEAPVESTEPAPEEALVEEAEVAADENAETTTSEEPEAEDAPKEAKA